MSKKVLKSGNITVGTCGNPTDLYDSDGHQLYVGDIVMVWTQDIVSRGWSDAPAYVVEEDGIPYIMGLYNIKPVHKYFLNGEPSDEEHYDMIADSYRRPDADEDEPTWYVIRVKKYDETMIGEIWGNVRPEMS